MPVKRYCTIQVDVDGFWVLKRLLGQDAPVDPDPVFTIGIERLVALFDRFGIKAAFFAVARDLESPQKLKTLKRLAESGHEIACHGAEHRYLSALTPGKRRDEIISGKRRIEEALGVKVAGFKSAGFTAHPAMVADLEEEGYRYDSSVLGTSLAFLMQAATGLSYPKAGMMRAPGAPYRPSRRDIFQKGESAIVELPVTTLPLFRLPAHFSYMVLGGGMYAALTRSLLKAGNAGFVNFLFHPLDLLDAADVALDVKKVRGLSVPAATKMKMAEEILGFFKDRYEIVTSRELAEKFKAA